MPRRLRETLRRANEKIAAGGDAISVYHELGLELAEMLADLQDEGAIQFVFTFNPPGFKIMLPKGADYGG